MAGMEGGSPPWPSSSSSSAGEGDLVGGLLILLLLILARDMLTSSAPSSAAAGADELASPLLLLVLPRVVWEELPVPASLPITSEMDLIIPPARPTISHLKLKEVNRSEQVLQNNLCK